MSRKAKIIAGLVALVVVGVVVAALAIGVNSPAAEIDTAVAVEEDLAVTITASGRVESGIRADVFPPTAAVIEIVQVSDGQRVAKGTVLATLETEPLALQVEQARAGVAQAESGLAAISRQEPTSAELESARRATAAAWQQYQAALAGANAVGSQAPSSTDRAAAAAAADAAYKSYLAAKSAYDLLKAQYDMFPDPSLEATLTQAEIAKDQAYAGYLQLKAAKEKVNSYDGSAPVSQARAASDQAYAGYLAARAQQGRLEGTNLSPERRAAQAAVDQAREALVLAQDNLDTAALIAPVDGIVFFNPIGAPAADGQTPKAAAGAAVAPQSAPFTVVDLSAVRFVAEVDEVDIGRIKPGMDALVNLDAFATESFESTVTQILSAATLTATGGTVFPVQVDLSGIDADLLIGMKGDVSIEIDSVPGAVTIPIEALFDESGTSYVYTVGSDDVLSRVQVQIGTLTETRVQVTSGLSDGDVVALSGPVELEDGLRIQVKR